MRTISRAAAEAGVSPDTLRYYERVGLLGRPERTASGYRVYDADTAERIRLIKGAQRLGLRLESIRGLLTMLDAGACPCGRTQTIAEQRLAEIDAELGRLQQLRDELAGVVHDLADCPDPPRDTCWCQIVASAKGGAPQCK